MRALFLLPLMLLVCLPLASGLEVIVDRYSLGSGVGSTGAPITVTHPSATAAYSSRGQSFRSYFDGANLTVLQVRMYQASATGTLTAKIQGHTGLFGSSGTPNGTVYATFDAVQITAGAMTVANFTFASGYVFDSAENYFWTIEGTSGDVTSEYLDYDNTGLFDHVGNAAAYSNSAWAVDSTQDLPFIIYGSDGSAVSFSIGGDVTINEITEVTNVTSSPTVNVTTGDVNVGGVTAEFNNTIVNATGSAITAGDVSAGAVTAGDVTAAGAVTFGGDLSVNGTFENATLTYLTSTAVSGDANVYFLIAFIGLAVLLTFYNKVPLLNFLVGVVGLSFIMLTIAKTDLPFWPYSSVLLALTSLICMISGGFKMRNN